MKAAHWRSWFISIGIVQFLVLLALGQGQPPAQIDLAVEAVDFTVISRDGGDVLGSPNTITFGDFNDDGILDLLLGAPGGDGPDDRRRDAGEAYIIYGRPDLPPTFDVDGVPGPDVIIWGTDPGDKLGSGVAAGDVDGDGIDDVILGAPGGDGPTNSRDSVGEVVVILGSPTMPAKIDLAKTPPRLIVYNNRQRSRFGTALQALDLNGDGTEDLVIADPSARSSRGNVYVIYGRKDLPNRIDIADPNGPSVTILGVDAGDKLGSSLAGGDLNRDGIEDLILGAPGADGPGNNRRDGGEAYVIFGDVLPKTIDLAAISADVTVYGAEAQDQLGSSVFAGDVNGDGIPDLLVGAPGASGPGNQRGTAGEVYIVYGKTAIPSVVDVQENAQDVTVFGARALDNLGSAVATGDLDGDGLQDLILGAKGGRGPEGTRSGAGNIYAVRSTGALPKTIDLATDGANLVIFGAETGDGLGSALAAGAITGRREGILIMGAPGVDSPGNGPDAGSVYALRAVEFIRPNQAPIANAGADQTVFVGSVVQLDATASSDPDGDPLTFSWEFVSVPTGSTAALSDPTSPTPTFTADLQGEYVLELRVDDGRGGTSSDRVTITATIGLKGDVDGDGEITILDARLACEAALGLRTLDPLQTQRADVVEPLGTITLDDAQRIAQMAVGLITVESTGLSVLSWQALIHRGRLEFRALGIGINSIRVEVFNLAGQSLFRSPWTRGNRLSLSWQPLNLANGVYLYVMTVQGANGQIIHKVGKFIVLR